jgi:cytidyltransferase-like protein
MKYKSSDTHKKSFLKSFIWRIVGVLTLAGITYFYTGSWITTTWITFLHHGVFLIVFYLHERFWERVNIKNMLVRSLLKCLTYETILGNFILGIITLAITGDIQSMTKITLTYIGIKHLLYIWNEFIWKNIKWGKKRKKVVYAYVVADLLHVGHLKHLERAKKQGDYLIVGVLSDGATMEKKPEPIISFSERLAMVEALKCVDEVVPQLNYSPLPNVEVFEPDVLMESTSHKEQPANDFVLSYGGKVIQSPYYEKESSTLIKKRILERG